MTAQCATNFADMSFYSHYTPPSEARSYRDPCEDYSYGCFYPNTTVDTNGSYPQISTTPFGSLGDLCNAFTTTELSHSQSAGTSPLSSPGYLQPVQGYSPTFGSLSPASRGHESRGHGSPGSSDTRHRHSDEDSIAHSARRKRGRPRLDRTPSASADASHTRRRSTCLPHKQVERKYREGLNMEFERLRRAVPTLPQSVDANVMGAAKPSKGMVLAAAIDYIKRIERERDAALDEVERLGGNSRMSKLERCH
jgi:hypothetical protein